ncbi:MAG TPA: hypothetical protein VNW97_16990 [Candidatus Saccharimonadales bacterium]|jgi:hypothetical protein|nr:hypothetical protein [Candidatus Saccharimonadales bacterium]
MTQHESTGQRVGGWRIVNNALLTGVIGSLIATGILSLFYFAAKPSLASPLNIDPEHPVPGQQVRISWAFAGADHVEFQATGVLAQPVPSQFSFPITVHGQTFVTLTASKAWLKFISTDAGTLVVTKEISLLPLPTVRFWTDRSPVFAGEDIAIHWETTNADRVLLREGDAPSISVEPNGSRVVHLVQTETFAIAAYNARGVAPAPPITVMAQIPNPTAELWATPPNVEIGGSSTITWTTKNADAVNISGIGEVEPNGSRQVRITQTTTYQLAASGNGKTVPKRVTVFVHRPNIAFMPNGNNPELEAIIRSNTERFFRAKGFEIVASQQQTAEGEPQPEYVIEGSGTFMVEQPKGLVTRWASVARQTVSATVFIRVIRTRDRSQIAEATGIGKSGATSVASAGQSFSDPELNAKVSQAVSKAATDALNNLSLPDY